MKRFFVTLWNWLMSDGTPSSLDQEKRNCLTTYRRAIQVAQRAGIGPEVYKMVCDITHEGTV